MRNNSNSEGPIISDKPTREELVEKTTPPTHEEFRRIHLVSQSQAESCKTGGDLLAAVLKQKGSDGKLFDTSKFTQLHEGNFIRGLDILQPEALPDGRYPPQLFYIPVKRRTGLFGRKEDTDEAIVGIKTNNDREHPDKNTVLMYHVKIQNGGINPHAVKRFTVLTEEEVSKGMNSGRGRGGKWLRGQIPLTEYQEKYGKWEAEEWANKRRIRKLGINTVEDAGKKAEAVKQLEGFYIEQLADYDKKTAAELKRAVAEAGKTQEEKLRNQKRLIDGLLDVVKTGAVGRQQAEQMVTELGLRGVVDLDRVFDQFERENERKNKEPKDEGKVKDLEAKYKELEEKLKKENEDGRKRELKQEEERKAQEAKFKEEAEQYQRQVSKLREELEALEIRVRESNDRAVKLAEDSQAREVEFRKTLSDKESELAAQKEVARGLATLALERQLEINRLQATPNGNLTPKEPEDIIEGEFREAPELPSTVPG